MKILVAVLLLAAAAGAYLYFNPELTAELTRGTPLEREPASTELYKWRDASGEWHLTDQPPPEGIPFERLRYREDVNIMPRLEDED